MPKATDSTKTKHSNVVPFERDAEFFFKSGNKKLESGLLADAISYFRRATELGDAQEHRLALAQTLTAAEEFEKSNKYLYYTFPDEDARPAEFYYAVACNYAGMREGLSARFALLKCIYNSEDEDAEGACELFESFELTPDLSAISSEIEVFDESVPAAVYERGRQLMRFARYEDAIRLYERCLTVYPDAEYVKTDLIFAYVMMGDFSPALEHLQTITPDDTPAAVSLYCITSIFRSMFEREAIDIEVKELMQISLGSPDVLSMVSITLMVCGQYESAMILLKKLAKMYPYNTEVNHRLGICHYAAGETDKAIACYDTILKMFPEDIVAIQMKERCRKAGLRGEGKEPDPLTISYLPDLNSFIKDIKVVEGMFNGDLKNGKGIWDSLASLQDVLLQLMKYLKPAKQRELLENISTFGLESAEYFLRQYALTADNPYSLKCTAVSKLIKLKAKPPYCAAVGCIVIECGRTHEDSILHLDGKMRETADSAVRYLRQHKRIICAYAAAELFEFYTKYSVEGTAGLTEKEISMFCAQIEFRACLRCGLDTEIDRICERYLITKEEFAAGDMLVLSMESDICV